MRKVTSLYRINTGRSVRGFVMILFCIGAFFILMSNLLMEEMQSMAATSTKTKGDRASMPALDQHIPEKIETATFAMG